jgi:glyoxylate reductase
MELKGKNFGILGAGRIGRAVAKRAKSFGTNILYVDQKRNIKLEKQLGAEKVSIKYLLQSSDILSVHLPLKNKTYHYLNQGKLNQLKKNSILVNTSRGEVIDEKALISLLRSNRLMAVGLDVFENEPKLNQDLLKFPNVIVLPHLGSATREARDGMAELAVRNVINVLKGKQPITPVY